MRDYEEEKRFSVGKLFRWALLALSLAVYVFGICLLITTRDPHEATDFVWTPEALEEYNASPDDFQIYRLEVMTNYTRDGRFFVIETRYLPSLCQIQFTLKLNHSTLRALEEEYGLPDGTLTMEDFYCTLDDGNGNTYTHYSYLDSAATRHDYRRLVFDGVPLDGVDTLTLRIYSTRNTDEPCGEIVIYRSEYQSKLYGLKRRERPGSTPALTDGIH